MINVSDMVRLPKQDRIAHLALDEPCIERGGNSVTHRGVLAEYLNTNIPEKSKGKICVCHACNNGKCSNPRHLYWGTYVDNNRDAFENGKPNVYEATVKKYGAGFYKEIHVMRAVAGGKASKGRVLSDIHKLKISQSVKTNWSTGQRQMAKSSPPQGEVSGSKPDVPTIAGL